LHAPFLEGGIEVILCPYSTPCTKSLYDGRPYSDEEWIEKKT
jgi:hypothetical protein